MKPAHIIITALMLSPGILQADNVGNIDEPSVYHTFDEIKNKPAASISHRDGWSIVSLVKKDSRVYWFLAPDEHNVTPALIKKTINENTNNTHDIVIISECEAPKQKCDALMKHFDTLSKDYK